MATIDWAAPLTSSFTYASNWIGGVVPGAQDTAVINAVPAPHAAGYDVLINTDITLGGLVLDANAATIVDTGRIIAGNILAEAGIFEIKGTTLSSNAILSGGSLRLSDTLSSGKLNITGGALDVARSLLTGTVTQTGGTVVFGAGVAFKNAIWEGDLNPIQSGSLTVTDGLTLTGTGGTGPGAAHFTQTLVLNNVATLNNATITFTTASGSNLEVERSQILSLGAELTLVNADLALTASETVVNNGTYTGNQADTGVTGGTFTNNGTISGYFTDAAQSFTNNGLITVGPGQTLTLSLAGFSAGAAASIVLDGAELFLPGDLTTAQINRLYETQHITGTGSFGIGLSGTVTNTGATLQLGTGALLGNLEFGTTATIQGGTILDSGGFEAGLLTLQNFDYTGTGSVSLYFDNWTNVTLSGATSLSVEFLSLTNCALGSVTNLRVGGNLVLNGATSAAPLTVNLEGGLLHVLTLDAGQSVAGDSFIFGERNVGDTGWVNVAGGMTLNDVSFDFTGGRYNELTDMSTSQGITLGTSFSATLSSSSLGFQELILLGQGQNAAIDSAGTFTIDGAMIVGGDGNVTYLNNSGLITVGADSYLNIDPAYGHLTNTGTIQVNGGTLEASIADLQNNGYLSVTNGTLVLEGPLKVANLNRFSDPNSSLEIAGTLNLNGTSVTPGANGVQNFSLLNGTVTNGTLNIAPATTFTVLTISDGQGNPSISAALTNNGTIVATLESPDSGQSSLTISGAVSGHGTIMLESGGTTSTTNTCTVALGATVSAGQTISFISGYDTLEFTNPSAAAHFAGTITGLDTAGSLNPTFQFDNELVNSARIVGHDILVNFSNGASLTLVSAAALQGSVSILNNGGNGEVIYTRPSEANLAFHQA